MSSAKGGPVTDQNALALQSYPARLTIDRPQTLDRVTTLLRGSPLAGLIEVRGLGILRVDAVEAAPLVLLVDLVRSAEVERLPESRFEEVLGLVDVESQCLAEQCFELLAVLRRAGDRLRVRDQGRDLLSPLQLAQT